MSYTPTEERRRALFRGWPSFTLASQAVLAADRLDDIIDSSARRHKQSIAAQFTHLRRRLFGDGHRSEQ